MEDRPPSASVRSHTRSKAWVTARAAVYTASLSRHVPDGRGASDANRDTQAAEVAQLDVGVLVHPVEHSAMAQLSGQGSEPTNRFEAVSSAIRVNAA